MRTRAEIEAELAALSAALDAATSRTAMTVLYTRAEQLRWVLGWEWPSTPAC